MQRTADHDLLTTRWREQVTRVVDLSLRLHSLDDDDPTTAARAEAIEAELTVARHLLADIEIGLLAS
ncbi:MAG: hypothetical protein QOJ03_1243 [Frankiaceae bacterium]|nr:hypothetical protein [Frankiaceae bacterium]